MEQISFCLTNYNRSDLIIKSFAQILGDERIGEIIISDDCSNIGTYQHLVDYFKFNPKVKFFRNYSRLGCYENKHQSVLNATFKWCVVADSDNEYDTKFIDKIYEQQWNENTILQPDFLKPVFDYRRFSGITITKENVWSFIGKPMFDCLLNSMNFFINRDEYLRVWQPRANILGADSIYFNYLWFKAGNKMLVVPGLDYNHLVHEGSNYKEHERKSAPQAKEIEKLLKQMR